MSCHLLSVFHDQHVPKSMKVHQECFYNDSFKYYQHLEWYSYIFILVPGQTFWDIWPCFALIFGNSYLYGQMKVSFSLCT